MSTKLQIGLDFDGVIADYRLLKSLVAKELFNKIIPPEMMESRLITDEHPLTLPEYRLAQKEAILGSHPDLLKALPGSIAGIKTLISQGHQLKVVTSRVDGGLEAARVWLENYNIVIPMVGVGYGNSKLPHMKNLDIYVDDGPEVLEKLKSATVRLFLFDPVEKETATGFDRLTSWQDLLTLVG